MFYDRPVDTRQIRLGQCEHILVITKELQEFSFVLRADFGTYHDGSAWNVCAQRDCLRDIDRFHALGFGPFLGLSHLRLSPLLFSYCSFVALIFVDDMDLPVMH
jgi:hypothetical protein